MLQSMSAESRLLDVMFGYCNACGRRCPSCETVETSRLAQVCVGCKGTAEGHHNQGRLWSPDWHHCRGCLKAVNLYRNQRCRDCSDQTSAYADQVAGVAEELTMMHERCMDMEVSQRRAKPVETTQPDVQFAAPVKKYKIVEGRDGLIERVPTPMYPVKQPANGDQFGKPRSVSFNDSDDDNKDGYYHEYSSSVYDSDDSRSQFSNSDFDNDNDSGYETDGYSRMGLLSSSRSFSTPNKEGVGEQLQEDCGFDADYSDCDFDDEECDEYDFCSDANETRVEAAQMF